MQACQLSWICTGFSPGSQAASCGVKCGDILKVFKCTCRDSWPGAGFTNVVVYSQLLLFIHNCCDETVTALSMRGFRRHALVHTPVSRSHALFSLHAPTLPLVQEIDGVDVLKSQAQCASGPDPSCSGGDFYGHPVFLLYMFMYIFVYMYMYMHMHMYTINSSTPP